MMCGSRNVVPGRLSLSCSTRFQPASTPALALLVHRRFVLLRGQPKSTRLSLFAVRCLAVSCPYHSMLAGSACGQRPLLLASGHSEKGSGWISAVKGCPRTAAQKYLAGRDRWNCVPSLATLFMAATEGFLNSRQPTVPPLLPSPPETFTHPSEGGQCAAVCSSVQHC